MELRISGTVNDSIVDGPGIRFTIFTQGCPHNCEDCHNPQTHDFCGGKVIDTDELLDKIKSNPLLDGVTFSGGEPFCQAKPLAYLARQIHELGLDVMIYTGYLFEFLLSNSNDENAYLDLIQNSDTIMDGKFEKDKKSYLLKFRGSSNQRYIDCKKSLEENKVVIIED